MIRMRPPGAFAAVFADDGSEWWAGLSETDARQVIELDALYYELADRRLALLNEVDILEKRIKAIKERIRDISEHYEP